MTRGCSRAYVRFGANRRSVRTRLSTSMRWAVALVVAGFLGVGAAPAAADTFKVCGVLESLQWPNGLVGTDGSAVIAGQTYALRSVAPSGSANKITRQATVGTQVCLSGDFAPGRTDVVRTFVLDTCATCAGLVAADIGSAGGLAGGLGGLDGTPLWLVAVAATGGLTAVLAGRRRQPLPSSGLSRWRSAHAGTGRPPSIRTSTLRTTAEMAATTTESSSLVGSAGDATRPKSQPPRTAPTSPRMRSPSSP